MISSQCVTCDVEIVLEGSPELGQKIICPNCATTLEIVWLYPVTMDTVLEYNSEESRQVQSLITP